VNFAKKTPTARCIERRVAPTFIVFDFFEKRGLQRQQEVV
jgi:hypothetical protein